MIAHYEDTKKIIFFSQLINLKQKGLMVKHIEDSKKLNIREADILEEHVIDLFMGNLKYNIQHEVLLRETNSLEKEFMVKIKVERKIYGNKEVYHSQLQTWKCFSSYSSTTYKVDTTTIGRKKRKRALL